MSKQQKKFQKKKEREREVRKKILHRREVVRSQKEQEEAKLNSMEKEYLQMQDDGLKSMPIINDPAKRDAAIKARLQRNLKILEALEKEYQSEMAAKTDKEASGKSLREMMTEMGQLPKELAEAQLQVEIEPENEK